MTQIAKAVAAAYHAKLSPSGAHRWLTCAGSVALEDGLPDTPTEYSEEGDCAHAVAAMCLNEDRPATAYTGRHVTIAPCKTYEFREDMAEPVQRYVDFVKSLPGERFVEVAVPIGHITGEKDATGTSDTVLITEDLEEIIVVDLKFGMGVRVVAEENPQGMLYALGAIEKFDVLGTVKRARIIVHQPRLDSVSEWDCTREALDIFAKTAAVCAKTAMIALEFKANWVGKSNDYLAPSEDACRFCKAKATCPGLSKFVTETVGADFETISAGEITHNMPAIPAVHDAADLAKKMAAANLIEDWLKAVRAEVERRLLAAEEVPGYKLVQGRQGNRVWSDEKAAEEMLRKQFRLPIEQAYNLELISPTQAEKLAPKFDKEGKAKPGQAETPIGERQWKKLVPLIVRSDGKLSVAPVTDPRPAHVVTPVADDFATVEEEGADLV